MEVTVERNGDGGMLSTLVEGDEQRCRIERAIADGAYDSCFNFTFLAARGIEATIKVRRSSSDAL